MNWKTHWRALAADWMKEKNESVSWKTRQRKSSRKSSKMKNKA